MEIQMIQTIHFNKYSVRKSGEGNTGELIDNSHGGLVCCILCYLDGRTEEQHAEDIFKACRALGITYLVVGRIWGSHGTIVPAITVAFVDGVGNHGVKTQEQEVKLYEDISRNRRRECGPVYAHKAEKDISDYLIKRRALYRACDVPCPLGAV